MNEAEEEKEIQRLQELNTTLSKALAEEIASNFKEAHLRANLEEKIKKAETIYENALVSGDRVVSSILYEILKEEKS